jgi:hypothetical protein
VHVNSRDHAGTVPRRLSRGRKRSPVLTHASDDAQLLDQSRSLRITR